MSWLRALLISSAIIASVQSFPLITVGQGTKKMELETKEKTDPSPLQIQEPQVMSNAETISEAGSSSLVFVYKNPNLGLSVQNGSTRDQYTISNLPAKNNDEKLKKLPSSEENEMDAKLTTLPSSEENEIGASEKDELFIFNITELFKDGDQWLFEPQEMSSIVGGLPKYFYDAAKFISPFPELSETVKSASIAPKTESTKFWEPVIERSYQPPQRSGLQLYPRTVFAPKTESTKFREPIIERSYQPPQRSGPQLYPRTVFDDEIDLPFYKFYEP